MMQSGWAGLIRLSNSGSWGWDGAYPRCHRVKGVVHPRCETNHTLSHLHPIKSHVSVHREAHRLKPARFWIWQVFQRKHVSMIQLLWLPQSRWSQVKPGEARWAFSVLLTPSASDWGCQTCRTTESNPTHTGGLKVWKFYDSHYSEGNVSTQEWKHKESEKFFAHEGFVPS